MTDGFSHSRKPLHKLTWSLLITCSSHWPNHFLWPNIFPNLWNDFLITARFPMPPCSSSRVIGSSFCSAMAPDLFPGAQVDLVLVWRLNWGNSNSSSPLTQLSKGRGCEWARSDDSGLGDGWRDRVFPTTWAELLLRLKGLWVRSWFSSTDNNLVWWTGTFRGGRALLGALVTVSSWMSCFLQGLWVRS